MAVLCWNSCEEIPHVQGKRNPSKTVGVARGHQRANTLKPYSQKTSQSNHTRNTALSNNETKPCPWGNPRRAGHGGEIWQNVVHWRREWQTTSVFLPWEPHEQWFFTGYKVASIRRHGAHLETFFFFFVKTGETILTSSGQRPRMLLDMLQYRRLCHWKK